MRKLRKTFALLCITPLILTGCGDYTFDDFDNTRPQGTPNTGSLRLVTQNFAFSPATAPAKADVLFVVDNSGSMAVEQEELANRFSDFITSINNLDWQVCVTTTEVGDPARRNDGRLLPFPNNQLVITKSTPDANAEFIGLINNIPGGSGDERGVYAAIRAFERNEGCFRDGAALSVVLISDEDERSAGGDPAFMDSGQFRLLEAYDQPATMLQKVNEIFGANKIFAFHSLIIKPGDET
jgi:hypothetical protein